MKSFNPCFTGTSSHTRIGKGNDVGGRCFNPCFTGTSSHTILYNRQGKAYQKDVSILVLLEPPLILVLTGPGPVWLYCFNPCFTGTSSHTFILFHFCLLTSVSILVLLEPPLIPDKKE